MNIHLSNKKDKSQLKGDNNKQKCKTLTINYHRPVQHQNVIIIKVKQNYTYYLQHFKIYFLTINDNIKLAESYLKYNKMN